MKILLIRDDKIGDFIQILPAVRMLQAWEPPCELSLLVSHYQKDCALLFGGFKQVLCHNPNSLEGIVSLIKTIKQLEFDMVISFFNSGNSGFISFASGIPRRVAPATKISQFFYNHRLLQKRSQSLKSEADYNLELAGFALGANSDFSSRFRPHNWRREDCQTSLKQVSPRKKLRIHLGNLINPSSPSLSLASWTKLIQALEASVGSGEIEFIASSQEFGMSKKMLASLGIGSDRLHQADSLQELFVLLDGSRVFMAPSTGSLHLAASLGVAVVGFFPNNKESSKRRWRPLGARKKQCLHDLSRNQEGRLELGDALLVEEIVGFVERELEGTFSK